MSLVGDFGLSTVSGPWPTLEEPLPEVLLMRVAIVVASRHGSTTEIGHAMADRLKHRGLTVSVTEPVDADIEGADAVIIGSAVYAGSWVKDARSFVDDHTKELATVPVWLFSSGPLDDPDTGAMGADKIQGLTDRTHAIGHHVFAGRLDRDELGLAERLVAKMVHAPDGDFRDWADIAEWADQIAEILVARDQA